MTIEVVRPLTFWRTLVSRSRHLLQTDILYTIRLSVQKSKFKGFGAFLTYLGALKLDESIHKIGKRMLGKRTHFVPQTALALQGVDVDGWEKTVRVTGENLHRNNNNVYWPKNMLPMFAVAEGTGRRTTVYLSGEAALEDDQDFKDTKFMEERLADMKQKGLQPIGHLGLYCIDDYKPAPGQYFDLMGSQIDIGVRAVNASFRCFFSDHRFHISPAVAACRDTARGLMQTESPSVSLKLSPFFSSNNRCSTHSRPTRR